MMFASALIIPEKGPSLQQLAFRRMNNAGESADYADSDTVLYCLRHTGRCPLLDFEKGRSLESRRRNTGSMMPRCPGTLRTPNGFPLFGSRVMNTGPMMLLTPASRRAVSETMSSWYAESYESREGMVCKLASVGRVKLACVSSHCKPSACMFLHHCISFELQHISRELQYLASGRASRSKRRPSGSKRSRLAAGSRSCAHIAELSWQVLRDARQERKGEKKLQKQAASHVAPGRTAWLL